MASTIGSQIFGSMVMSLQISKHCSGRWTIILLAILLSLGSNVIQGKESEICVVKTPLSSPYFIPYIETENKCNGCSYVERKEDITTVVKPDEGNSYEAVHVIQVENVVDSVLKLDIEDINGQSSSNNVTLVEESSKIPSYVFVITSSELIPISIVVYTDISNVTFKFLTRLQDYLYFDGTSSEHSVHQRFWSSPEEALEGTKKEFGVLHSFTRAKHVNKIGFDLNKEDSKTDDCSINTDLDSSLAKCSLVIKKQTSGCFHEHMLGYGSSDIYIIDVESEFTNAKDRKITLHVTDTEDETLRSRSVNPVKRNLTLVLRSTHPTLWTLKVSNVHGLITLYVADGGQVENKSCPGVSVSVKKIDLPKTFDQTILRVLATIGPLVSYTLTESPSIIQLVIPTLKKSKSTKPESKAPSTDFIHSENAQNLLSKSFTYECYSGDVTIILPLWVDRRVGGVTMMLRDQACQSHNNGTHLVLRSTFSECGFLQEVHSNYYLYTNLANLEFGRRQLSLTDDEDFEGSGFEPSVYEHKIPKMITCKSNVIMESKTNMEHFEKNLEYSLQVYRDENMLKRIQDFPVNVPSDSTIYAKVEFAEGLNRTPDLKILIEQCILSSSPHYVTSPVTLVRKSCAQQPYVTIKKSYINTNVVFHFVLSLESIPAKKVYLHCQIGVCSNVALPQPYLNKCVDPGSYCNKDSLMKAFGSQVLTSLVDTVVVGPFDVLPLNNAMTLPPNYGTSSTHKMLGASERKTQIVVMEGLSTEVVVGIAIASFIIGVCLTATLWIIYLKTDPRRQSRPESVMPRNSGYDLSGHSGSSTPSSQAPMTT